MDHGTKNSYNLQTQVCILIRKMSWSGGDWMSGVCEHINFKKREACQSCGYPKYGGHDPSTYENTTLTYDQRGSIMPRNWVKLIVMKSELLIHIWTILN